MIAPVPPSSAEEFREKGYTLGPRILEDAEADELAAAAVDALYAPTSPFAGQIDHSFGQPFIHVRNLGRVDPRFAALGRDPLLHAWACVLTGAEELKLFEDRVFYKPPHEDRVAAWHNDTEYLPFLTPFSFIVGWVALTEATEANGAMRMIPGSHRWGPVEADLGEDLTLSRLATTHPGARFDLRLVPKGHVHFHDPAVWHASGGNRTSSGRVGHTVQLVNATARFDPDHRYASFFPDARPAFGGGGLEGPAVNLSG